MGIHPFTRRFHADFRVSRANRLSYSPLEGRQLLAFTGILDVPTDTLYLIQTADDGVVLVDNNGTGGAFRVSDGAGTDEHVAAANLTVRLLGTAEDVTIDLDQPLAGGLRVTGLGADLWMTGDSNSMAGRTALFGNAADQVFHLSESAPLQVAGDLILGGGNGYDAIQLNGQGMTVGGSLIWDRINEMVNDGIIDVQGNFSAEYYDEAQPVLIDNNATLSVVGNWTFNYYGGSPRTQTDSLILDNGAQIGGRTWINLGGSAAPDSQQVSFQGSTFGDTVTVLGGPGDEEILLDMSSAPALINILPGTGSDSITVGAASPDRLRVDFAGATGAVQFDIQPDFDVSLLNWSGINRYYIASADELRFVQTAMTDELTVISDSISGSLGISVQNGAASSNLFSARTLRVLMLDGSGTPLTLDLDHSLSASLYVWLGDGDRTLDIVGSANEVGSHLRIDGGAGDQTVTVANGSPLAAGLDLRFEMRMGSDTVLLDGSTTTVGRRMYLRDANFVTNNSDLMVADDLTIWMQNSMGENDFQNNANMHIGRDFVYGGWLGRDVIGFHGTEQIDRYLRIAAGDEFVVTNGMTVAGIVDFSGAGHGNSGLFRTDADTVIGIGVSVWFGDDSPFTEAEFRGQVNGGHVIYHGTPNKDSVLLDVEGVLASGYISTEGSVDTVTLARDALFEDLIIDFGAADDIFVDEIGVPYPFPVELRNLP